MAFDGTLMFGTAIDNSGFESGVNNLQATANVAIGNIAADMVSQISSVMSQIPQQMVAVGSEFEASMSQVAATMGITSAADEFVILSEAAKEMGEATKFSASQAGEALNYLALAGYDAEKAVSALPTVLNVAAAGGMDLAYASDLITDAMSALGLETAQMSTFADQLAVTAQKSNTSVSQLGEAILTVGGTAKTLSGGVVEMNTALGILADNGIKGAEGGTALRNVILSLSAPTSTAAEALESLSVSAFDASGTMRPLEDTFADLNTALSTLTDQEKTAVLNEIFNKVDLKSVNALLGTSAERFDELSGYISNCSDAAADMAKTMDDNLKGDITILGSAIEGLGIAAYEKFQEPFRESVQEVTGYIGNLTTELTEGELSDSVEKIAEGFSDIATAALDVLGNDVIPAIVSGLETIVDHAEIAKNVLALVVAEFVALKATAILTPVINSIMAANTALTLLAAETSVATFQQAALASGMSLTEIAVGLFTGKLTLATAAQATFNTVVAANPLGILLAAFAAVTAAALVFSNTIGEMADEIETAAPMQGFVESSNKAISAMKQQREEFEKLKASQEEKSAADNAEINNIQRLWSELQNYIDESGNVISNNERASEIIGLLNDNYDMNIDYIGNQIQGYSDLASSMDEYIEKLRLETRIRNNQPLYDQAIANLDELQARYDELNSQEKTKTTAFEASINNEAKGAFAEQIAAIRNEKTEIEAQMAEYQKAVDEYESMFSSSYSLGDDSSVNGAAVAGQYYSEQRERMAKEEAEALAKLQEENTEKLKAAWEQAEHNYAVGVITSEAELYRQKQELLDKYGSEDLEEHWKYYEDLIGYQQSYSEQSRQEYEQQLEDEWNSISHLQSLGLITAEQAYSQQLDYIKKYCSEYSDEWYSYYQTIIDYQREAQQEQVEGVRDSLSETVSEYKSAFSELESSVNSYKNRLLSVGDLISIVTETDDNGNKKTTYSVENLQKQMNDMQKYHDYILRLKERGASSEILNELTSYDFEDGSFIAENFAKMSDAEFNKINELYAQREQLADDLANELYADEMEELNTDLINSVVEEFGTLPEEIRSIGAEALAAFIEGISETENLTEKVSDFTDSFFDACNEGISEGAAGLNIADSIAAAFAEQDTYSIGKEKGDALVNGFNDALNALYAQFNSEQAYMSASVAYRQQSYQQGSANSSASGKAERIVFENHVETTVELDSEVVGKTAYKYTKEYERMSDT